MQQERRRPARGTGTCRDGDGVRKEALAPAELISNPAFKSVHHSGFLAMSLLFSYGTLQWEDVQLSTFGRLLPGQRDELVGFEPSFVKIDDPRAVAAMGKAHHTNVTFNGRDDSRVRGLVFEISEAELA